MHGGSTIHFPVVMTSPDVAPAAELFKVLSSTARLKLLVALIEAPSDVGSLAAATDLSQPLASQHLRTLRLAGLVDVERTGRSAIYSVTDRHVSHIIGDAIAHAEER